MEYAFWDRSPCSTTVAAYQGLGLLNQVCAAMRESRHRPLGGVIMTGEAPVLEA
ncbi:hypothetical protein [Variovorax boronicumulans]|uniref:hypothetical protein n=1 Tax=Variovorax boronicumulans TaxID=436515 RepID=UPI00278C9582|nr:hypothetical protein [Variovorax boronicumulans]MDP9877717.1 hypothetical protein [Variovorax boronicumulans]